MSIALKIRKVRTASGATAVQLIRYANGKRIIERHIGSAHTQDELTALYNKAERVREQLNPQRTLFPPEDSKTPLMHKAYL